MRTLSIARKTIVELAREPVLWGIFLIFPALMVAIYFVAFGQPSQGTASMLRLLILNQDAGPGGAQFVQAARAIQIDGKPVFAVETVLDRPSAETSVRERKATLLIVIPPDFSASPVGNLQVIGEPESDNFIFASSWLSSIAESSGASGQFSLADAVTYEFLPGTGTLSDLQYGVPGTMIFGITFGIFVVATLLVRVQVSGVLQRLRLTRMAASELLLGMTLANMLFSLLQLLIAFATAFAFGLTISGSLALMLAIGALFSLSAVGLGLIIACFTRNDGEVIGVATVMLFPLVFLSGAIMPMAPAPLMTIGNTVIELYDLMPTTHAAEAMRRVMIYGDGPSAIAYELTGLIVISGLYLVVGSYLYRWLKLGSVPVTSR